MGFIVVVLMLKRFDMKFVTGDVGSPEKGEIWLYWSRPYIMCCWRVTGGFIADFDRLSLLLLGFRKISVKMMI